MDYFAITFSGAFFHQGKFVLLKSTHKGGFFFYTRHDLFSAKKFTPIKPNIPNPCLNKDLPAHGFLALI
jgi:hypothetical protein